jgi:hypothetical protein
MRRVVKKLEPGKKEVPDEEALRVFLKMGERNDG